MNSYSKERDQNKGFQFNMAERMLYQTVSTIPSHISILKFSKITTLKWLKLLLKSLLLSFSFLFFLLSPPVWKTLITVGKKNPNINIFHQYILKIWSFRSTFHSTSPISVQEVHISTYQYEWPPWNISLYQLIYFSFVRQPETSATSQAFPSYYQ